MKICEMKKLLENARISEHRRSRRQSAIYRAYWTFGWNCRSFNNYCQLKRTYIIQSKTCFRKLYSQMGDRWSHSTLTRERHGSIRSFPFGLTRFGTSRDALPPWWHVRWGIQNHPIRLVYKLLPLCTVSCLMPLVPTDNVINARYCNNCPIM